AQGDAAALRPSAKPRDGRTVAETWALAANAEFWRSQKAQCCPFWGQTMLRVRPWGARGFRLQRACALRLSMDASQPPFRAEVIGSLLRPRALKDAVAGQQAGLLTANEADAVLDREVARVIACQEAIGFRVVTDGELARTSWFGFFFEAMAGFRLAPSQFKFKDALGRAFEWQTCVAAGPVSRRASITLGEYQ